ncbi:MAG: ribonuclease [Candidatus Woesearchaeota archaeon]|nr:ribonuclease [Candidatus Woesearchaeota archaeon]MDN5327942.1 ribonuclease [Candidatus Woesearchaeota archaeon]
MIIAGIDEAGRGPLIGPLVLAIAVADSNAESLLTKLGVKDSKKLTKKTRERIFEQLKKTLIFFDYKIIFPAEIDFAVNSKEYNLNWLEADATAFLINKAVKSLNPKGKIIEEVYIDLPSTNQLAYVSYLKQRINSNVKIIAEHKADDTYPIVSAASIIAKVVRDNEIEKLKETYGDFGSGYPADPKTQKFLKENFEKYNIFRKSWKSYQRLNSSSEKPLNSFFKKE